MRKLLQNKAVVTSLVLVAAICFAREPLTRLVKKADLPIAARVVPDATPLPPEAFPIRTALQIATNFSEWRSAGSLAGSASLRDPFSPVTSSTPATNVTVVPAAPTPPTFTVQAISIDGDRALAVVNHQVLATGDQIEGYRVEIA